MSAGLGEACPATAMQVLGGERGEVIYRLVGPFVVEPGDPVQDRWHKMVPVALGPVGVEQLDLNRPIWGCRDVLRPPRSPRYAAARPGPPGRQTCGGPSPRRW